MADRPEQSADDATPPNSARADSARADSALLLAAYTAIDACRPGSEDLERELPAEIADEIRRGDRLAARYRSVQRLDHAIATAFLDAPLPIGLADRLLAAIAEQQAEAEAVAMEAGKPAAAMPVELLREDAGPARSTRRRWLQICGSALGATAAGGGFLWWRQASVPPDLTLEDVLTQTLAFHESAESRIGEAIPISREPAPADFPLSRRLGDLRDVVRWRRLSGLFLGREGVAYELVGPNASTATLYVLASDGHRGSAAIPSLPDQPRNPHTTGGFTLAGWREEERIQLLVVKGDAARYNSFLTKAGVVT